MASRRVDRIATVIVFATLAQLVFGVLLVRAQRNEWARDQAVVNSELEMKAEGNAARLTALEALNIASRLAVLERGAEDVGEVRKLLYGVILTLAGSLLAQIVLINGSRKRRE